MTKFGDGGQWIISIMGGGYNYYNILIGRERQLRETTLSCFTTCFNEILS